MCAWCMQGGASGATASESVYADVKAAIHRLKAQFTTEEMVAFRTMVRSTLSTFTDNPCLCYQQQRTKTSMCMCFGGAEHASDKSLRQDPCARCEHACALEAQSTFCERFVSCGAPVTLQLQERVGEERARVIYATVRQLFKSAKAAARKFADAAQSKEVTEQNYKLEIR